MTFITKILLALLVAFASIFVFSSSLQAQSDFFDEACSTGNSKNSPICKQVDQQNKTNENPISGPRGVLKQAADIFALVAVVAGTILIIYSGFIYATAGGARAGDNASRAREARSTIVSAVVGIIIVALAWTIVTIINTKLLAR